MVLVRFPQGAADAGDAANAAVAAMALRGFVPVAR
jgi:hypothetical protein